MSSCCICALRVNTDDHLVLTMLQWRWCRPFWELWAGSCLTSSSSHNDKIYERTRWWASRRCCTLELERTRFYECEFSSLEIWCRLRTSRLRCNFLTFFHFLVSIDNLNSVFWLFPKFFTFHSEYLKGTPLSSSQLDFIHTHTIKKTIGWTVEISSFLKKYIAFCTL